MTSCTSLIVLILVVANIYRVSAKNIATQPPADIFTQHIDNNDNNNKNLSPGAYKVIASRLIDVPKSGNSHDSNIQPTKYIATGPSADIFTQHLDNNDNNNKNLSPGAYKVIASRSIDVPESENSQDSEIVEVISEEIYEVRKHRVIKRIHHRNKPSSKKSDEKTTPHKNSTYRFSTTSTIDKDTNNTDASSVKSSETATTPLPNFTNGSTTPTTVINKEAEKIVKHMGLPLELQKFSHDNAMPETTLGEIDKVIYYTTDKNHYEITTNTPELKNGTTFKSMVSNSSGSLPSTTSEPASSGTVTPVALIIPELVLSTTSESVPLDISTPVSLVKSESVQLVTSEALASTSPESVQFVTFEPVASTSPEAVPSTTFEPVSLESSTTILLTNPESVSFVTSEPVASTSSKPVASMTFEPVSTTLEPVPSTTFEPVLSTTLESVPSTTVKPVLSETLPPPVPEDRNLWEKLKSKLPNSWW